MWEELPWIFIKTFLLTAGLSFSSMDFVSCSQNVTDSPISNNNSTNNTTISDDDDESSQLSFLTKSVISLVGLGICILIALTVGRVVDRCHDVLAVRDDRSDMSDKTRDLLKIKNAATFIFRANTAPRNANAKVRSFEAATKWGRVWLVKARQSRRNRRRLKVGDVHIPMPQESMTDHVFNGGAGEGRHNTTVDKGSFGEKNTMAERRQSLTVMLFASKRGQMRQPQTTKSGDQLTNHDEKSENKFIAAQKEKNEYSKDADVVKGLKHGENSECSNITVANESVARANSGDDDVISSDGSFAEITAELPDATNSQPIKISKAFAFKENTMDDKLFSPETDKEFCTERPMTSESVKLEPSSSVDETGWSPRPRCATVSSLQLNNELKSSKEKGKTRPLTAKSKGELTQGVRKSQSQTARTNAGAATGPKVPGNTVSRPKTPGPKISSSKNPTTQNQRSKSTVVSRPKTPASTKQTLGASRPKTPAPNSARSKPAESKTVPQRPKTPVSRPKTAGLTAHMTSTGQSTSPSVVTRPKTPRSLRPNTAKQD